jgi:hypothetical protein
LYNTTFNKAFFSWINALALNIKMILKNKFGNVREENIRGLYERISQNISGGTKENQEISQSV